MLKTVLIVEDDHETRVALREAFEAAGYYVFSVANGPDGLIYLRTLQAPFVVLLDQNMPLMSGDDVLRIRLRDPELLAIPVIVMSAVGDRTAHLGADEFVSKPIEVDALVEKVNRYFGGPASPAGSNAPMPAGQAADRGESPEDSVKATNAKTFSAHFKDYSPGRFINFVEFMYG